MRDIVLTATIGLLLSACGTAPLAPVTYHEPVSVQSVLPVHVRLNATLLPGQSAETVNFAEPGTTAGRSDDRAAALFGTDDQSTFIDSLKSELVRHGVFGSISATGGPGVVDLDIYFSEIRPMAGTEEHRLRVAMVARYRKQVAFYRYDMTSRSGKAAAATKLLNQVMVDVQTFVDEQQISLRTGVKDRRVDIDRMLVKW